MGNVKRFAAVNTKAKALEGKLLKNKDYIELLNKKNEKEVLEYLKENTSYREILKDVDPDKIQSDKIGLLLLRNLVAHYEKFIHFFTAEYKKLFRIFLIRFEISDIKLFLKKLMGQGSLADIKDNFIISERNTHLDYERMLHSKSLEEFIENINDEAYRKLLKPYLEEEPERRLFYMEMALDRLYFKKIIDQINHLSKEDQKVFGEFFGRQIDLMNLQWIYRGLKLYGLSPEELINYSLPGGLEFRYERLRSVCYSKSDEELIEKISHSSYGFLVDHQGDSREIYMERRIQRYMYFYLLSHRKGNQMTLIQSISYLHLLEYEMRDIISILEAVRYGLKPEDAEHFLIRKIYKEGA